MSRATGPPGDSLGARPAAVGAPPRAAPPDRGATSLARPARLIPPRPNEPRSTPWSVSGSPRIPRSFPRADIARGGLHRPCHRVAFSRRQLNVQPKQFRLRGVWVIGVFRSLLMGLFGVPLITPRQRSFSRSVAASRARSESTKVHLIVMRFTRQPSSAATVLLPTGLVCGDVPTVPGGFSR